MKNDKSLRLLLTPSWVVNFVGITLAILTTVGVIVLSQFQGSELRREIFELQSSGAVSTDAYDSITTNIANNSFLNTLPLLIVWACVGVVVYFFAAAIIRALGEAVELHDELDYVHVSRESLMREALLHLGIRAILVIAWFVFIKLSVSVLVPYALASANIASGSWSLSSIGYGMLAALVLYADVYIHAIFLRLIAFRARLFGDAL